MFKKFASERTIAIFAFAGALSISLVALPLLLDDEALAFDAKGDAASAAGGEQHHRPLPSEMIEARLAYAKTALKITDAQSKQWDAVAAVLRKQAKDKDALITARRAYKDVNMSVVDRLQQRQKMMSQGAAGLAELLTVVQPLYATFSPEQKQVADDLLMPHFGEHHHGHFGRY